MKTLTLLCTLLMMSLTMPTTAKQLTLEAITGDTALTGPSLKGAKLSPDGKRVTYLKGRDDDQYKLDIWQYDIAAGKHTRLVDADIFGEEKLSDEEKARRERQRTIGLRGILNYDYAPDGKQLLFIMNGLVYVLPIDNDGKNAKPIKLTDEAGATDARLSELGGHASYVKGRNLRVVPATGGKNRALTQDGGGTIANGVAEFVADEEMGRHTGYWWSPDDKHIAYLRFDESPVPLRTRMEINADGAVQVQQRYPAAGDPNVLLSLHVVEVASGKSRKFDLGSNDDIYVPRVDWVNADTLAVQRQNRNQRQLDLIIYDIHSGKHHTALTEQSDSWVELHDAFRMLDDGKRFLWQSERSGSMQLYLGELNEGKAASLKALTKRTQPMDDVVGLDEANGTVFITAGWPKATQRQVWAVALDGQKEPKQITPDVGMHYAKFSGDGKFFVDTWSSPTSPPQLDLRDASGKLITRLLANDTNQSSHPYNDYLKTHINAQFGTLKAADGHTDLHYKLYKPAGFESGKKYPAIVYVYGGPAAQTVTESWAGRSDSMYMQYLAQQGYVVFSVDNRGTPRRDVAFTRALYEKQGTVEVEDQVAGIDWLIKQGYVDGKRIGVFGWSNGGYMTLHLLAKTNRYACGISGAPVTDWALYDTHYTERYMNLPQANKAGYKEANLLNFMDGITEPLLLIHGMADDNVLFDHSLKLIKGLQERAQPFELMTYPGARHGLKGKDLLHRYKISDAFFAKCLKAS